MNSYPLHLWDYTPQTSGLNAGDVGREGKGRKGRGRQGRGRLGGEGTGMEGTPKILLHPQFQFSRKMPAQTPSRYHGGGGRRRGREEGQGKGRKGSGKGRKGRGEGKGKGRGTRNTPPPKSLAAGLIQTQISIKPFSDWPIYLTASADERLACTTQTCCPFGLGP